MMNKNNYNLREKVNKFGILSTHVYLSIGPEARKKGLKFSKNQLKKSVFLIIVEGKTDKKFYDNVFNRSNSVVIDLTCGESASEQERKSQNLFGKTAVQTLFERSHQIKNPDCHFITRVQKNMALGLIDLDFDKYPSSNDINYPNLYKPQQYLHIFTTETNDLETLLLQYGILDNLLSEIFKKMKNDSNLSFENFKEYVFLRIKHLNYVFRLTTKKYHLSWKHVKVLNLEEICSLINTSDDTLFESLTALIFHRDSKNNNNLEIKEKFTKEITIYSTPIVDLYNTADFTPQIFLKNKDLNFCQGHNTMTVLLCMDLLFLHHRISENELFDKIADDCLSNNRFQKMQLYKSLRRWEDNRYPLKPSRMFTEKLYDLPQ